MVHDDYESKRHKIFDPVPMSQEPSCGSGMKRSNFDSLRRAHAESEKGMKMRWGMVDDCYALLVVAWWHPRGGAEYRLPPSYSFELYQHAYEVWHELHQCEMIVQSTWNSEIGLVTYLVGWYLSRNWPVRHVA